MLEADVQELLVFQDAEQVKMGMVVELAANACVHCMLVVMEQQQYT